MTASVLGEVAYLRRTAELMLDRLKDLDGLITGHEQLTSIQEGELTNANQQQAGRAREHLQLAEQYVDDWSRSIDTILRMPPSHLA